MVGALFTLCLALPGAGHAQESVESSLPSIGGAGGGLISDQQELQIGQQVLRQLRRSAQLIDDFLIEDYLSSIVYKLVPYVALENRDLSLVVIDSPALNAFAVPGNVIGVNGGLFLRARTEQQFASVIAHELAHLSQRHFARRMEQQEQTAPLALAGVIAGLVLSAVTQSSDIGMATVAGTQAMAVQNFLSYSRLHEQEADRVGLGIMAEAGLDPEGMPEMFEIMLRENRLQGNQVPEYLSTHPLTESRVSDTRARAEQLERPGLASDSLEFHLVKTRLQVHYARSADEAVEAFGAQVKKDTEGKNQPAIYGYAVALIAAGKPEQAHEQLQKLLDIQSNRITYLVTDGEALIAAGKYEAARQLLTESLKRNPGNAAILDQLARLEMADNNPSLATGYLQQLTRDFKRDAQLWLRLADAQGKAREIVGVHRARAEYDILMGDFESAARQLAEAQTKTSVGSPERQVISQRLNDVTAMQKERR